MKKQMKKFVAMILMVAMAVMMSGCAETLANMNKTTTDHVQTIMDAYKNGDTETFMKALDEDNKMNYMMKAIGDSDSTGMKGVYQKVYELTKAAEITVIGPSTEESKSSINDEYITVQVKTVDFSTALRVAMVEAAQEGGEAFADMPGWMMKALETGGEPVEYEFDVRVDSRGKLAGETHNEDFYYVMTGGFYDYITYTMTTCTSPEATSYMIGSYDSLIVSLDEYYESAEGYGLTQEDVDAIVAEFAYQYKDLDGIAAGGELVDNQLRLFQMVDYEVASTYTLQRLGMITGGYGDYISLSASINSMEESGFTCEKTDFGSGVLAPKTDK